MFFGGKVGFVRVPWRFSYYFYVVISCPVQIAWICAIVILFWPHIIIIRIGDHIGFFAFLLRHEQPWYILY